MSNEILLNKEYLVSMSGRFEGVFKKVDDASQEAYHADHYSSMRDIAVKSIDDLRSNIRIIIDSFSSTDQNLKEQAQSILGVEYYNAIASDGQVTINPDGSYVVKDGYDLYRQTVNELNSKSPNGVGQAYSVDGYTVTYEHIPGHGICTVCSNATLVNRRLALEDVTGPDGQRPYYSAQDALTDNGNHGDIACEGGTNTYSVEVGGTTVATYSTTRIYPSTIRNEGVTIENKLIGLLQQHPEGVQFYTNYSGGVHGIVITSFSEEPRGSGNFSYMAYDPVTGSETPLKDTWLYNNYFSGYSESDFINSCSQGLIYLN